MPSSPPRQERKVVTVLFADLVGFTARAEQMDPEDVVGMLQPYHARLRDQLEHFGGTVEKFIGDAVMAVFGAPVAHEDDPERAVRAALAIRDWAEEEAGELELRIAVNTGEALVSLEARPEQGESMVAGDVVNTASRLQSAAPVNGILVGETTQRATRDAIEYREAEPVEAKGKAEPVRVWEAVRPHSSFGVDVVQEGRTPLVGRQSELDLLADALARARQEREPQLVTLVGVPGIGKSRLVLELFGVVDSEPELIWWRQGRSLPYGEGVTYWALEEIAKAQAGILESDGAEEAADKLRRAVGDLVVDAAEAQWIESHLRPLVGLTGELATGDDRRAEAFSAWRRFFEALAERNPLVLVFEDLQWADDGLLDFVDYLVDWASGVPLLAVCSARPELLERRPGWGGGKRNATTVSLSPLSTEDTSRLVAGLLEQAVLPVEVQSALLARAEGNPLYAEEYARVFLERGSAEDLPLPETVQGLIAARLDALPPEEKELTQAAAVVGKVFWSGALAAIGGEAPFLVEERLHALERKEFVRRERRSSVAGETQYAFLHVLVRDVAYSQIPRAGRAEKHRLAAEWIGSLGRSEDHAEMLAHHYLQALELAETAGLDASALAEPARIALSEAGDSALALSAFGAAARFYTAALELWPQDDPGRPILLFRAAKARWYVGPERVDAISEAADALLAVGDRESAAEAETLCARELWNRGERDAAYSRIDRAMALVESEPPSSSKAHVLAYRSRLHMLADEDEEGIRRGREALAMAEQLGLEGVRAQALNVVGTARVMSGDQDGMDDIRRSLAIATSINSPDEIHRALNNLANMHWYLGELQQASEMVETMLERDEHFGLPGLLRWGKGEEVLDRFLTGRWAEAERLADAFLAETAGSRHYLEVPARSIRAKMRLARSDLEEANADSARALKLAREAKDPQALLPTLAVRALVLLAQGRANEAAALVDELHGGSALLQELALVEYAWCAVALDRREQFRADAARIRLPSQWVDAATAIVDGDPGRAADVLAEMGARGEEARARLRAAEQLVADGRRAEADAQLQQALAFFREQGATAYARQAESLLAASA
jgi:class 3 adenylate cyclase/tetratricopeptide (TPR) repeat protein